MTGGLYVSKAVSIFRFASSLLVFALATLPVLAEGISLLDVKARQSADPKGPQAPQTTAVPPNRDAAPMPFSPAQPSSTDQRGEESWRQRLPQVAYVIISTGDDESYFEALARGSPSTIVDLARSDAAAAQAAAGLSGRYHMVRVRVSSPEEFWRVLRDGMVPSRERANAVYSSGELVSRACSILSVTVISHAGSDGPLFDYHKGRGGAQANYNFLKADRDARGPSSLYNRLVRGARLRFAGCNTGSDYLWYEWDRPGYRANPSVAHGAAAILAGKGVVAWGKYNSSDVKSLSYVSFRCPAGLPYPTRHGKPKDDYSFGTTRAAVQYEDITVQPRTAEERQAYVDWYRQRGYQVSDRGAQFVVRAPRPVWYNRRTPKPIGLVAMVKAVEAGALPRPDGRYSEPGFREFYATWYLVPWVRVLFTDDRLMTAIRDSKQAHGGRLDIDDFRIWAVVFRPDRHETALRADLCDDPRVAEIPSRQ